MSDNTTTSPRGEESISGEDIATPQSQGRQATTIIQQQNNFSINRASDGGQNNNSGENNSNTMYVTLPTTTATKEEDSCLHDIFEKVNEATFCNTTSMIAMKKDLSEPEFQVHPQMREARSFYDGNHISLKKKDEKIVTKKRFFGLLRKQIKKIDNNQIIKESRFDASQSESRCDAQVTMESLTGMIMKERNLRIDEKCGVICLTASAGYGKTTLMRRLGRNILSKCKMSENNKFISPDNSRFDMVRSIDFKDINYEKSTTLANLLFKGRFSKEKDRDCAFNWLLKNQSRAVLFLDGFDQATWRIDESIDRKIEPYDEASTDVIIYNLLSRNLLPHLQIVMSSREFSVASLPEKARPANMISLIGLKEDDVKDLFTALLSSNGEEAWKKVEKASGLLRNLIQIPIYLVLTAVIMARDLKAAPPDSATQLIDKMFQILPNSSNVLEYADFVSIVERLKNLAHEGMVEGKVVFSHHDLKRNSLTIKLVRDMMIQIPGVTLFNQRLLEGDFLFYFCHQSLQEYLSARYISEMEMKDFKKFRSELADSRWSIVIQFLCGIIFDDDLGLGNVPNRKEKQKILHRILESKLKNTEAGHQKMETYASLRETRNRSVVASLVNEIHLKNTKLNRYGIQIVGWMLSCRHMGMVYFQECGIDDDLTSALTEELKRMENKPQVEMLMIYEDDHRLRLSKESLLGISENLLVGRMMLWDRENKLKYHALDWKNIDQLDVIEFGGNVGMDFGFANDQDFVLIDSPNGCYVTIQGAFAKLTKYLTLQCDEESSDDPSRLVEAIQHFGRFFQPILTVSVLEGKVAEKHIYFKDFNQVEQTKKRTAKLPESSATSASQVQSEAKYIVHFCADVKSEEELSGYVRHVERNRAEYIALHIKYEAQVQNLKSFIQQCKGKELILVKHPSWNPSLTDKQAILDNPDQNSLSVKICTYNADDREYGRGEWKELKWVSYWEEDDDDDVMMHSH